VGAAAGLTRIDADIRTVMVSGVGMHHQPRYQDENHCDSNDHQHDEFARRMIAPLDASNAFR
jgi:hypothetical protein